MTSNRIVIEAGRTEKNYWKDLWLFRELFYILSWRDITVRYKQTALGAAWSIIRPLLTTIIFTIIFSRVAKLNAPGNTPYAIMVFVGMLPWQFFANALNESSNSLVGNSNLISKVYFPRMIIPASAAIVSLVDFFISFLLLLLMMIFYQYAPGIKILLLPAFILLAFLAAFGVGLYITALNVKYRDFRHIIPFIIQIGLYITPVGFSSTLVPAQWRILYSLNPMVGVVDGFRWCIVDESFYWPGLALSILVTGLFLIVGINISAKRKGRLRILFDSFSSLVDSSRSLVSSLTGCLCIRFVL